MAPLRAGLYRLRNGETAALAEHEDSGFIVLRGLIVSSMTPLEWGPDGRINQDHPSADHEHDAIEMLPEFDYDADDDEPLLDDPFDGPLQAFVITPT